MFLSSTIPPPQVLLHTNSSSQMGGGVCRSRFLCQKVGETSLGYLLGGESGGVGNCRWVLVLVRFFWAGGGVGDHLSWSSLGLWRCNRDGWGCEMGKMVPKHLVVGMMTIEKWQQRVSNWSRSCLRSQLFSPWPASQLCLPCLLVWISSPDWSTLILVLHQFLSNSCP